MCMAYPYKIKKIKGAKAIIDNGEVDLSLVNEIKIGDWVLVKDNLAVTTISEEDALNMIELLDKARKAGGSNVC